MTVTDDTIGHSGREQRLDGTEDGYRDGRRHKTLDDIPREGGHLGTRQLARDGEPVADGLDTGHAHILFQQQRTDGHHDDSYQTARQLP